MPISHVQVLSVPVSNQDRAIDFYVNKLGFELLADAPIPGMRWVMVRPPAAQTALTLVTWFDSMPAGSLKGLVVETADLDATVAELHANGVETTPPEDAPWGRFVMFDDPDGNGLVLQQSAWVGSA